MKYSPDYGLVLFPVSESYKISLPLARAIQTSLLHHEKAQNNQWLTGWTQDKNHHWGLREVVLKNLDDFYFLKSLQGLEFLWEMSCIALVSTQPAYFEHLSSDTPPDVSKDSS